MRRIFARLICFVLGVISGAPPVLHAQYDQLPQVGLKQFAQYQHSDIDSVDLSTGNVNLHIPLVSFPQKGGKLRLNFIVRYNEPQWSTRLGVINQSATGVFEASGDWSFNINAGRPVGVDVVRDQGITGVQTMTNRVAPGCCGNGDPVPYYSVVYGIRDRSGAEHDYGMYPGVGNLPAGSPTTGLLTARVPDGSGWVPTVVNGGVTALQDHDGLTYTPSFLLNGPNGTHSEPVWTISDVHSNTISTAADGWHDSMGRTIPGSWGGPGAGVNNSTSSEPLEDDPFPGVPSNNMAACANGAVATRTWVVPSSSDSGGSQTYTFCYSHYTGTTNFTVTRLGPYVGTASQAQFSVYLLSKILLPNGTSYAFQYDPQFLDLTRIDLPTGGVVTYQYSQIPWEGCSTAMPVKRVVVQRTEDGGTSQSTAVWKYRWSQSGVCENPAGVSPDVVVTKPDGNDEWHHTSLPVINSLPNLQTDVVSYQGATGGTPNNPTGAMLKKVQTTAVYNNSILFGSLPDEPADDVYGNPTTIPGISYHLQFPGPVSTRITTLYDPNTGSVQSSQESDSTPVPSSGSVLWIDPSNYWYPQSGTCACLNYSEVASSKDYDVVQGSSSGPGTLLRQTATDYRFQDTNGQAYADAGLTGLPSSVTILDANNNQAAQVNYRYDDTAYSAGAVAGELTTTQKWQGGSNWITSHTNFNGSGVFAGSVDPMGTAKVVTDYDCSEAFPSKVTVAGGTSAAENVTYVHDCNTGAATSYTDPNSQTTTYSYADPLNRITAVHHPDGGSVQVAYTDGPNGTVNLQTATGGTQGPMSQTVLFDLLGRTVDVQTNSPGGTIHQTTAYDSTGRVWQSSTPYTSTSDTTYGVTTNTFDGLGRTSVVANPDGSTKSYSYNGQITTSTDENGISRNTKSDGLGRLVQVSEPNGAVTAYHYDALGNLTQATQTGLSGEAARSRTFSYDTLSRLITSQSPETGTICYGLWSGSNCVNGYDANGNLLFKTDARGVVTTYSYDALNRLDHKSYSDGTLSAAFGYDGYDEAGNNLGVANAIGRLSHTSNQVNVAANYSYDPMGRIKNQTYCLPSDCSFTKQVSALYDLAGNLNTLTYPDGRVVQQGYDAAGRMSSVNYQSWGTTAVNQPYLTASASNSYDPAGHLVNAVFGNNVPFGATYDNRERVQTLLYGASSAPLWSKQYAYTPSSNLQSYTDLITGVQRQFGYDSLNRLTSAQDIFSNLAVPSGSNNNTGSTSSSGSAATVTPGATGAVPWLTNPDDSNLLSEIGAPDGTWGMAAANLTLNAAQAPDGTTTAARVDATSGSTDTYINGFIASPSSYGGETMSGSVWLRSVSGTMNVALYLVDNFPGGYDAPAATIAQLTTTWQQFQLSGTVAGNLTALKFQIGGSGTVTSGQSFLVWNPMLEDAGISGTSVTNFALYSQRFSQWNPPSQGTVVDNSMTAPDGTNTAATLTANSNATDNFVVCALANPAPFSGVAVTGSVWLRVPSGNPQVLLTFYERNSKGAYVTGAQTITLSSTWQRFQVSGTTQSMLNYLDFQIGGGNSFTNGQVIYAWGAQVELASQAGPYVATGATPVTIGTTLTNLIPNSHQPAGSVMVSAPDGSMTASQVSATSSDSNFEYPVANAGLYDGATVTGAVFLQSTGGPQTINLYLFGINASGTQYLPPQTVTLTSTWQRFEISGTVPNGLSSLALQIGGAGSFATGQTVNVWGPQIQFGTVAGPYIATNGLPVITGSQPTNVLPNSQMMNGPTWAIGNGSLTSTTATAPDGSATASILTASPSSTDTFADAIVPNPSLYDGQTVTGSIYLRSTSGTQNVHLFIIEVGDQGWQAPNDINLTLSNTWQRYDLTATLQNGLSFLCLQAGGAGSVTNGQSFELWGAQFVIGTTAAPYTTTPSATTVYATGQPGTVVPYGLNEAYAYDSFGNILQNGGFNATYTANNQMFGYAYDAAGNLLSNGVTPLTWDAESRLTSAAGATYLYDAEGNRVEKQGVGVTDTIYFGGKPIARLAAGQWTDLIYGPAGLLAEVPGTQAGVPEYRVTDHLGTTVGNLTAEGRFINPLDYRPFGGVFSGNTDDPYLFTGKERDAESGLDYFGARYYASNMGRWMSPDWADKPEAVPYSSLDNPQSLNLYGYVGNNPLSKADADGHCCSWDDVKQFAAGAINAWGSDNLAGAGRIDPTTSAGAAGARLGDFAAAVQGVGEIVQGAGAVLGGGAEALVTSPAAGTGIGVVIPAAGAAVAVAGAVETVHGVATAGTAVTALMKSGGNFSQGQKQAAKDAAGGKCQNCGAETTPGQKSQKGVTPPGTQGEGDHIIPKSKGGTNGSDNIQHLCRDCNAAKGNKMPGQ